MGVGLVDAGSPGHQLAVDASELTGLDMVRLSCEASKEELRATEVAQPVLLLHSVALLQGLPAATAVAAVAGHSLGEYSALVAAGSLEWQDALLLVRERGLAMAEASAPGQGMSAVLGMDEDGVTDVLATTGDGASVVVANINAPGQIVISGQLKALHSAAEGLRVAGAKRVMPLSVAGAFHSPLMSPAAARLALALETAPLRPGRPQAFNVDGRIRTEPDDVRAALKAQLTSTVRWVDCVRSLLQAGVDRFQELGPGSTLSGLGKRIAPEAEWFSVAK